MMKQRWGLDRNVLQPTPGDPWCVEQHHWNTGAEENQQLNPGPYRNWIGHDKNWIGHDKNWNDV